MAIFETQDPSSKRRGRLRGVEASRRVRKIYPPDPDEEREVPELTAQELRCGEGHRVYLEMLEAGEIVGARDSALMPATLTKGRARTSGRLRQAVREYEKSDVSLFAFCRGAFQRFRYSSANSMMASMRTHTS